MALLNLFLLAAAILCACAAGFVMIGLVTPPTYSGSRSRKFNNVSAVMLYTIVRNIDNVRQFRHEVTWIDVVERNEHGPVRWNEYARGKEPIEYHIEREQYPTSITIHAASQRLGMSGSWSFTFEEQENDCIVNVHEESTTTSILSRALLRIAGRDANIKRELGLIEYALLQQWAQGTHSK